MQLYNVVRTLDITPLLELLPEVGWYKAKNVNGWTTQEFTPPEFYSFVEALGLGGITRRLYLRKLLPNRSIPKHDDGKDEIMRRFHIPLLSHPEIKMRWPDHGIEVYMEPGVLYEVNYWEPHEIINNTSCERIHVQIDQLYATIEGL